VRASHGRGRWHPSFAQGHASSARKYTATARGIWSSNQAIRQAERDLAAQAEVSYKRMVNDQRAGAPARKVGRERDTAARMK
jgi:hypothetical protein